MYISTDMVFYGDSGNYSENDPPRPINYYGNTKLAAERLCIENADDAVVIRITLQYGWGHDYSGSFCNWLNKSLEAGKEVHLYTDQFRSPTYVCDTAKGLEIAALRAPAGSLFHLAAPERVDRYSFGLVFAADQVLCRG